MFYGSFTQSAAPATEPVTLSEACGFCRINEGDDDVVVNRLIASARRYFEETRGIQIVTATWVNRMDAFPCKIALRRPPLLTVTSIVYKDTSNATQTLSASEYTVDIYSTPGRIVPAYGYSWPSTYPIPNAVTVTYTCGYGAASAVPDQIKQAILYRVQAMYDREDVSSARMLEEADQIMDGAIDTVQL